MRECLTTYPDTQTGRTTAVSMADDLSTRYSWMFHVVRRGRKIHIIPNGLRDYRGETLYTADVH